MDHLPCTLLLVLDS